MKFYLLILFSFVPFSWCTYIDINIPCETTYFRWIERRRPKFQDVNLEPLTVRLFEARNFNVPEFLWTSGTPESVYYLQ